MFNLDVAKGWNDFVSQSIIETLFYGPWEERLTRGWTHPRSKAPSWWHQVNGKASLMRRLQVFELILELKWRKAVEIE